MQGRLPAAGRTEGLIPGEGAGFLLVERQSGISHHSHGFAMLIGTSTGRESNHFRQGSPNNGDALTAVLQSLCKVSPAPGVRADLLYTCETGERFWAEELLMACLRNPGLVPEPFVRTIAAESFGDLGAAAGAIMVGLGLHALAHHQRTQQIAAPILLVCGSADDGEVGASLMQGLSPLSVTRFSGSP